jgi:hypothetical protein
MAHPPWLRFQAYVVGLPKTGSTSVATVFGNYRTGHESQRAALLLAGMRRQQGLIDDAQFWDLVTPRLTRPSLELDSVTCHYLYADALSQRFPNARFVHTVRDVGGWLTSLLDMSMRYRQACSISAVHFTPHEEQYLTDMTGGVLTADMDPFADDERAVIPLMRYWAEHMRTMARTLPGDRTLVVRTRDIPDRLGDLARLCGVPEETMRADLAHANASPHSLNRLALHDSPHLRAAYEQYCAEIMASMFPEQHARVFEAPDGGLDWHEHCRATRAWVADVVASKGDPVGR